MRFIASSTLRIESAHICVNLWISSQIGADERRFTRLWKRDGDTLTRSYGGAAPEGCCRSATVLKASRSNVVTAKRASWELMSHLCSDLSAAGLRHSRGPDAPDRRAPRQN